MKGARLTWLKVIGVGVSVSIVLASALGAWTYLSVPIHPGPGHDGGSRHTALVVEQTTEFEAVSAEYAWLATRRPLDLMRAQSLIFEGEKVYDVFEMQSARGDVYYLYFDITDAYGNG